MRHILTHIETHTYTKYTKYTQQQKENHTLGEARHAPYIPHTQPTDRPGALSDEWKLNRTSGSVVIPAEDSRAHDHPRIGGALTGKGAGAL